jgi:ribA/ribD-fused uncharacterized protein
MDITPTRPITSFTENYFYLSNFYEAPVRIGNFTFKSNEAAFQAAKYQAMIGGDRDKSDYVATILMAKTPNDSKQLGKRVAINTEVWDAMRVKHMREIVRAKFDQNHDLRAKLMHTGSGILVEGNTWGDTFWGRCNGRGMNILGCILMELRGYYYWKDMDSVGF